MTEEQIEEAVASAMVSVGTSTFLHGIDYSPEKFREELDRTVRHIQRRSKVPTRG